MSAVDAVHRHMYGGACKVAVMIRNACFAHQRRVARQDQLSVHHGTDAQSRQFFGLTYPRLIGHAAVGLANAVRHGVVGARLRQSRQLDEPRLVDLIGMHGGHAKAAAGERSRLVKDHRFRAGKGLQIAAALDEDAAPRSAADAAKEGQRNGDDQRAGAGYDKEDQAALDPFAKRKREKQRRQDGDQQRRRAHRGGIDAGKARDELFADRLFVGGILRKLQDAADGGGFVGTDGAQRDGTRQVHRAA